MNTSVVHDLIAHTIDLYSGLFATVSVVYLGVLFFRRLSGI